jgi:putative ABC transport system ATP-binding protein
MLLFETQAVCKHYKKAAPDAAGALIDVSLAVAQGSFTAILGPSGSGKTTLLALLGALERPTRGRVLFAGKGLGGCSDAELARVRRRIGFVFQDFSLIPTLSTLDNIVYPLIPRGIPRRERLHRAHEWLSRLGMDGKQGLLARELSGGEQQRAAVARALAGEPEALLADEPTSSLDAQTGQTLLEVFHRLHAEGKTVVVASHDPRVAALADQVVELEGGCRKAKPPGDG